MADFTSWEDLKLAIANAVANGGTAALLGQSMSTGGQSFTFRSISEIEAAIALCDRMTQQTAGAPTGMYFSRGTPR